MKERRVINISKEDFDVIKEFCNDNSYNMTSWVSKLALQHIHEEKRKKELDDNRKTLKDMFKLELEKCLINPHYYKEKYSKNPPSWIKGMFDENGNLITQENK
jgi:hypothetical protein